MKTTTYTASMITSLLLLGTMALYGGSEDDGYKNVYYGGIAGHSLNSESQYNLFVGYASGYYTEGNSSESWTGDNNVYLGAYSGYNNTTGYQNTFTGVWSGYSNTTGYKNTFMGYKSGRKNTTGYQNTFSGVKSGYENSTGNYNTFSGVISGYSNTTGDENTFMGYSSGYSNSTGDENTFMGYSSGYSNTTGEENTFTGALSGYSNTTGDKNTFTGYESGYSNTSGYENTFLGYKSGYKNTTGYDNTFNGVYSGYMNITGSKNTFLGYGSGNKNTTGSYNTFNGVYSGYQNTTGSRNTFLGYSSGNSADINSSVLIGYMAGYNATRDNTLYIANSNTDTPLIYGEFDTGVVKINGELNTTNTVTASVTEDSTANTKTLFTLMRNNTNTSYESDVSFVLENVQKSFQWTFRTLASEKGFSISKVNSGKKEMILTGYDHPDGIQILMGDGGKYSGGQWLVASSRAYKENIKEIDTHTALEAFHQLKPVHFNYKTDKKEGVIGFIAEDVPSIVATKKRDSLSAMEMAALLTKVIQVQERELKNKEVEIEAMKTNQKVQEEKIATQNEKIAQIELLLGTLTGKRLDKKEKPLSFKMK